MLCGQSRGDRALLQVPLGSQESGEVGHSGCARGGQRGIEAAGAPIFYDVYLVQALHRDDHQLPATLAE